MKLDARFFFSDRVVCDKNSLTHLKIVSGFWERILRIISWIFSPCSYSEENVKAVECFQKYLVQQLGTERLNRIQSRYDLNLKDKIDSKSPLLSRDIAKMVVGARNVEVEDINEWIESKKNINDPAFAGIHSFQDLSSEQLDLCVRELSGILDKEFKVPDIQGRISGRATEWYGSLFYDPFLADRERQQLLKESFDDTFETFVHNMVARVIKREMDVGMTVPAPKTAEGKSQYYYVSAKLVTKEGMVSYLIHPATNDTNLPPLRLFRGTAPRNGEVAALATLMNDAEKDLGKSAYESGKIFEPYIKEKITVPKIEAGHSLGSTIVQWRLANMDHINHAYLYCGPGLPMREVQKFNQKAKDVDLTIRITSKDSFRKFGDAHLGYRAPPEVRVDLTKYYPPKEYDGNPHIDMCHKECDLVHIESEMSPERINSLLYHKEKTQEKIRSLIGPYIAAFIREILHWIRPRIPTRTEEIHGLQIGSMQGGKWHIDHFREMPYNQPA